MKELKQFLVAISIFFSLQFCDFATKEIKDETDFNKKQADWNTDHLKATSFNTLSKPITEGEEKLY